VDAAKSVIPSNVLHQVSAAELKAAEMIKLPLVLRGRRDPNDTIVDAIGWLDELAGIAAQVEAETGEFIRPVMLLQAERKSKTEKTLHAEEVKKLLIDSFRQPEEHIAIATGESNELDGVNLFARDCPVRFIITQSKLREGWDCSFRRRAEIGDGRRTASRPRPAAALGEPEKAGEIKPLLCLRHHDKLPSRGEHIERRSCQQRF
jgi:type III restriction enzyme